ncbi:complement component receptor 1-like protein [Misgurnus anguillicaudatus]|uniref:complement component receptor 1-like protein n=1 Tax=Misgurnus anguillicaudatus TaxID=75329 RepID=UPI003CCFA992
MRSSLAILSLWICFNIDVTTQTVCPEPPKVENAQVSPNFVKTNYSGGDKVEYSCESGYASPRKIVYVCAANKWAKMREVECTPKRCEQPTDIQNGQYKIQGDGKSFVVGTTIKYTCNPGYQMMSRIDTRTCRPGGWDNTLPECEEVFCALDLPSDSRIKVEGLPDYGDFMRHGHRLQFSCDKGDILRGHKEIICQSNGDWNHPIPKCEEMACLLNNTEDMKVDRIPNQEGLIKPGHRVKLSCLVDGLIIKGPKELTCQADGEWSSPFPKCEEVTCQEQELSNVQILMGRPGINPPYTSGHVLVFKCTDVNMKLYGQRAIECQSNGNWDNPYPKCQETKCAANLTNMIVEGLYKPGDNLKVSCIQGKGLILEGKDDITCQKDGEWSSPFPKCIEMACLLNNTEDMKVERIPNQEGLIKPGHRIKLSCLVDGLIIKGLKELTCQADGEWSSPFPKCEEPTCVANLTNMIVRGRPDQGVVIYKPHDNIKVKCNYGQGLILQGEDAITCREDGEWSSPFPKCIENPNCEPPPNMNHMNADTLDMLDQRKTEYKSGEKVKYTCLATYRMEGDPHLTCVKGEWEGNFKCIEPCYASQPEMDKRNIQLKKSEFERMYCPHEDYLTFVCKSRKYRKRNSVDFRQQCLYGKMTLPECE